MTAEHYQGISAAPGLAIGHVVWWRKEKPEIDNSSISDPVAEVERLDEAVQVARQQIEHLRKTTVDRMGEEAAAIFDAHIAFLDDPAYIGEMKQRIQKHQKNASLTCNEVTTQMAEMLSSLPDEYMQARADDIRDVGNRILLLLAGITPFDPLSIQPDSIVVAPELAPSDTAQFPPGVVAMVTARGSKTAHAAIMARTLGIPAVLGLGEKIEEFIDGDTLVIDGDAGTVEKNPTPQKKIETCIVIKRHQQQREEALKKADMDAETADGKRMQVFANIGSPSDVDQAIANGAEGIGLFRTEFLYLENDNWPTEEEQTQAYSRVLKAFGDKPVVIRTLDIGGDKDLPYANLPTEENPFLGHRAIRYCLANPEIFKTQLKALLRSSIHGDLWIMLPMVENLSEIREAKALLAECRTELMQSNIPIADSIKVGIMVEVPAAAIYADVLAKEVDFMSIGTNDLTQYTLAADRGNEQVAHLYDAAHPAVLRLVKKTCDAAREAGIVAGMCGELAGDSQMTEILIGLGLDELSMSAGAIPEIKEKIRPLHSESAQKLAEEALRQESPEAVRQLVQSQLVK
ncbi:phosphoenolpyruvate--protein phosphotransferase [Marininema mesophilum]|uniref:Phosphoenolpyruvate-protein phosphotransferase n=1 Tax=Marininema mesophilum TaxID=1048340 RepID=A0A1H2W8F7_9BACL|nr:phosphoenolpyruvate--protein phosphotransferase [Marininema mesophilum]SDW76329.1 phosphoenolpyruvate--protein phosphotransferase [Marininema mesophilum]